MKKMPLKATRFPALLLRLLLTVGNIYFAPANPYRFLRMVGLQGIPAQKREWRYLSRPLYRLQQRGQLRMSYRSGDQVRLSLTRKGRSTAAMMEAMTLKIPTPSRWDGKWRFIIFDVPNVKHGNRLAFTERLKSLGFRMIQRSVWIYSHECRKEISILTKFYEIESYVLYIESNRIEGLSQPSVKHLQQFLHTKR